MMRWSPDYAHFYERRKGPEVRRKGVGKHGTVEQNGFQPRPAGLLQAMASPPSDGVEENRLLEELSSEVVQLRKRLLEVEKLAAIGRLAGGIAHDFNNIISATLIHLELLQQDPGLTAAQKESLRNLEKETARGASLTRQLMAFSRRHEVARLEVLNLNLLISDLLKLLQRLVQDNVQIVFKPSVGEALVRGDVGLLEQVVMTLCLIARDSLGKGGIITLTTELENMRPGGSLAGKSMEKRVHLSVVPTPFTSGDAKALVPGAVSKENGEWIGIESAETIVEEHEGRLDIRAHEDLPSSFEVSLPLTTLISQEGGNPGAGEEIRGGSEMILLVEDEAFLRRVTTSCLRRLGYAVLDTGDGGEAMKLWDKNRDKIDLLFADLLLPGAETGLDLAKCMGVEKASLKIIVSSGDSTDFENLPEADEKRIAHLKKPYSASDLAKFVRRCLDAPTVSRAISSSN